MFVSRLLAMTVILFDMAMFLVTEDVKIATTTLDALYGDALYMEVVEPEEINFLFKVRPAKNFGVAFSKKYMNIELIPGDPYDGCSPLRNARILAGKIVLLQRGDCSFVSKTYNAQEAKAVAAIITNYRKEPEEDDENVDMISDNTNREIRIPSLFLMGKDGYWIKHTLEKYHMPAAVVNIPVNLTGVQMDRVSRPPWSLW